VPASTATYHVVDGGEQHAVIPAKAGTHCLW
jgi:hypothetical protein